jgi:hypothetical protein
LIVTEAGTGRQPDFKLCPRLQVFENRWTAASRPVVHDVTWLGDFEASSPESDHTPKILKAAFEVVFCDLKCRRRSSVFGMNASA